MPVAVLIPLYLVLALLPLALAWAQGLAPRAFADELASGAGLVALAMILAEFFLLGRFRGMTRGAGSDVIMRARRYSADPLLGWVWIAFLALAVGALLHVYLVAPLYRWRRPWRVASVLPATERTWAVTLSPDFDGRADHKAGQFAWLNIGRGVFSLDENPFSISSAPSTSKDVEFIIKELGDFTRTIGRIEPGTRAWLGAPHGHLSHERHAEAPGIALIAGGVGVAPLIGILRGPPPMLHAVEDALVALGIPSSRILSEQFSYD